MRGILRRKSAIIMGFRSGSIVETCSLNPIGGDPRKHSSW